MIHRPGDPTPEPSLSWRTLAISEDTQRRAARNFMRQAKRAIRRLSDSNRLDAIRIVPANGRHTADGYSDGFERGEAEAYQRGKDDVYRSLEAQRDMHDDEDREQRA